MVCRPFKTMEIQYYKSNDLIMAEYNPRQLTKDQYSQLKDSITRFGLVDPLIVNKNKERKNILVGGHQRFKIAKEMGIDEIPCVEVDLTLDAEKELNIRLNKNVGEWDYDALANYFDVGELTDWGFSNDELQFYEDEPVQGLIDDDEIPEVEEAITKEGDLWILGEHRVLCGDATEKIDVDLLMKGQKADMVFTDPPYGIDFKSEKGHKIKNDDVSNNELINFNKQWQERAFEVVNDDCFLMAWQSPRKFILMDFKGSWTFFRLVTMYKSNRISFPHGAWINKTEPCLIFQKGKPQPTTENYLDDCYIYKHDKESHEDSNVGHPTPKPVKMVIEHITACAKKGQKILDLFLGSGSTLIAAEKTNRKCYGMELDPHYCDVIVKRWEDFTGKKAERIERVEG